MNYQELQYLRDELNQKVLFHSEYPNKTINLVLIIWGGVLVLLGRDGAMFMKMSFENIPVYFIVTTILFISNLILYGAKILQQCRRFLQSGRVYYRVLRETAKSYC